jgi:hypothetical protein
MSERTTIYLVTVDDFEDAVIVGAYSTEDLAKQALEEIDPAKYGRFDPHIVPLELDLQPPSPCWTDGESWDD